jgi:hypothetical protein
MEKREDVSYSDKSESLRVSARERLNVLRNILYVGGAAYILITLIVIGLQVHGAMPESTELTILITVLGSALTTIIGVVIGSSLDNR